MKETEKEKIAAALKEIDPGLKLIRLVGRGSVGSVYECSDSSGTHIAVKLMEISPMIDPPVFAGIIQAAQATRSMAENVNVVQVFSAGKTEKFYYIIMEMINGGTLETMVNDTTIPLTNKLIIAEKIAEILAAIHSKGIVHKDLKPSNVLIDAQHTPFLNDFYLFHSQSGRNLKAMPHGTPYYMSPEQTKGQIVTVLTDFYSFGVLLYELFTGTMPYKEKPTNIPDMINVVNDGTIIPPAKKNRKINSKLEAVILKLLQKDPKERYQKMSVVAADLKACREGTPISIPYNNSLLSRFFGMFR